MKPKFESVRTRPSSTLYSPYVFSKSSKSIKCMVVVVAVYQRNFRAQFHHLAQLGAYNKGSETPYIGTGTSVYSPAK